MSGRARGRAWDGARACAEALEARVLLSTITYDGGPAGTGADFHDPVNWAGDALPGPADDAVIPAMPAFAAVLITQSTTIRSITSGEFVTQTAGTLTLSATSQFNDGYSLTGGTLTSSAAVTFQGTGLTLGSAGTLNAQGGEWLARTDTGTIDGSVLIGAGASFKFGKASSAYAYGATVSFTGPGTLKFAGQGFFSSTHTFNSNYDFTLPVEMSEIATIDGTGDLTFTGGLAMDRGRFAGAGGLIIPIGATFTQGDFPQYPGYPDCYIDRPIDNYGTIIVEDDSGDFTLGNSAAATFVNHIGATWTFGSWFVLWSGTFENEGTVHYAPTGQGFTAQGAFRNESGGVFDWASPNSIVGGGFINEGELNQNSSTAVSMSALNNAAGGVLTLAEGNLTVSALTNSGQVQLQSFVLTLPSDSSHGTGSEITGGGTLSLTGGTHTIVGATTWSAAHVDVNCDIGGVGELTIDSPDAQWLGGNLNGGTLVVTATSTVLWTSAGSVSRAVDNFGTFNANAALAMASGAPFTNRSGAILELSGGLSGSIVASSVSNQGTIETTSLTIGAFIDLTNQTGGLINVLSGTFEWGGGGTHTNNGDITVPAGATILFASPVVIGVPSTLSGAGSIAIGFGVAQAFPAGTFALTGGANLGLSSRLTIDDDAEFLGLVSLYYAFLDGDGDFTFSGGLYMEGQAAFTNTGSRLSGAGTAWLPVGQTASVGGSAIERDFNVYGTFTMRQHVGSDAGGLRLNDGATLTIMPGAAATMACNDSFVRLNGDGTGRVDVQGSFTTTGNSNESSIETAEFMLGSTGSLHVQNTFLALAPGIATIDGVITIDSGKALAIGGTTTFGTGGSFAGLGSLRFLGGTHTFDSNRDFLLPVLVGSGATLTGSGNFTFTGGLTVDAGTLAGSGLLTIPIGATFTQGNVPEAEGYPYAIITRPIDNFGTVSVLANSGDFVLGGAPGDVHINRAGAVWTMGPYFTYAGGGGGTLENFGTMTYPGEQWVSPLFTNRAGGVFHLSGTGGLLASIVNEGIINKTSSTLVSVFGNGRSVTNAVGGVINVLGGEFSWQTNASCIQDGSIVVSAGAAMTFYDSTTFGASSSVTGAGSVEFHGGTHVLPVALANSGSVTIGNSHVTFNADRTFPAIVNVFSSTVDGAGNLSFAGGLTSFTDVWNGVGSMTIPLGATATFSGPVALNRPLVNAGTMNVASGTVTFNSLLTNSGTLAVAAGATANATGATLTNYSGGTLLGGTWDLAGTLDVPLAVIVTTIDADTAVTLRGPGNQFPGLQLLDTNAGTLRLVDGRDFDFLPAGNLFTNTGTLIKAGTGTATIGAATTLDNQGTVHAQGGTFIIAGPVSQVVGGALTGGEWLVDDGAILDLTGALVTVNNADVTLSGSAAFSLFNNLTVNNGSLTLTDGYPFSFNPIGDTFQNTGDFIIDDNLSVTVPAGIAYDNTGDAQVLSGSTFTLEGGGAHTGDFQIATGSTLVFDSSNTFSSSSDITGAGDFEFASGTSVINGNVNIAGEARFTGNNERFTGAFNAGSIFINAVSTVTFAGATVGTDLTNQGVLVIEAPTGSLSITGPTVSTGQMSLGGAVDLEGGGQYAGVTTLLSGAVLTLSGVHQFTGASSVTGAGVLLNTGVVLRTGAGQTTLTAGVTFDNPGQLDVVAGDFRIEGPVTQLQGTTLAAGTWCGTDPGTITINGRTITTIGQGATVMLGGPNSLFAALDPLSVNSGWFTVSAGRNFSSATLTNTTTGVLNVGAGSVYTVTGVHNNNGLVAIAGGTFRALGGGTHAGAFTLGGNGSTLEFAGNHTLLPSSSITGTGTVIFSGGTSTLGGTIDINGTVRFDGNNETINGAFNATSTIVAASSLVTFNAAATLGVLQLTGGAGGQLVAGPAASLSASSVFNNGALSMGLRTLNVSGSYVQASGGALSLSIGGATAYGGVAAAGGINLSGTLNLALVNGYVPGMGANFNMFSGSAVSGGFTTVNPPPPPPGQNWAFGPGGRMVYTSIADYDLNGFIQPADVAAFVNAWAGSLSQGTLVGDFDHNGSVQPGDVAAFINAWFSAL